jgi:peptide/nickel transport system substrate-binding protein
MAYRLRRRQFGVGAGAAALAGFALPTLDASARAADPKTLRCITQSDLRVLDPSRTTAYITRNPGSRVATTRPARSGSRSRFHR